jgi:hypothetical protein
VRNENILLEGSVATHWTGQWENSSPRRAGRFQRTRQSNRAGIIADTVVGTPD